MPAEQPKIIEHVVIYMLVLYFAMQEVLIDIDFAPEFGIIPRLLNAEGIDRCLYPCC
ncbi:ATPase [Paenibacillus popilliae ATCC 14706]|uniref:ATPase n=1 Tax=Paenibacillus popilliae ATCC 14706 TaxID=1212764 RepID=M9LBM8_PAEPP|nr:ATPase [Paenibacillus popilliae ATCC 14706]